MKNIIVVAIAVVLQACNSNEPDKTGINVNPTDSLINIGGTRMDSSAEAGSRLIAGNDCLNCHRIEQKSIGPSYREIARQYEFNQGNVENLARKIVTGGTGLWGQAMMNPHPNLPERQAQEMVRYILSLRDSAQ